MSACHAVEEELSFFIAGHSGGRFDDGRARIVRHGHLPECDIQTGIGTVCVQQFQVHDRGEGGPAGVHYSPSVLP